MTYLGGSAVNFAPMTQSDQIENVLLLIELVNDAVITNAKPILGSTFKPMGEAKWGRV